MREETEDYTDAERNAADILGMDVHTIRTVIDTYMGQCRLILDRQLAIGKAAKNAVDK